MLGSCIALVWKKQFTSQHFFASQMFSFSFVHTSLVKWLWCTTSLEHVHTGMVGAHSYVMYRVALPTVCLFSVCSSFLGGAQFLFLFFSPQKSLYTEAVGHESLFSKQHNAQQFGLHFFSLECGTIINGKNWALNQRLLRRPHMCTGDFWWLAFDDFHNKTHHKIYPNISSPKKTMWEVGISNSLLATWTG